MLNEKYFCSFFKSSKLWKKELIKVKNINLYEKRSLLLLETYLAKIYVSLKKLKIVRIL